METPGPEEIVSPVDLIFWDWSISTWSSIGQLLLAAVGIYLALAQLRRNAEASEKTASAAERTATATEQANKLLRRRLLNNDLLVFLPTLDRLEEALADAVRIKDAKEVEATLLRFIRQGGTVLGLLEHSDMSKGNLPSLIEQALTSARRAKADIANGSQRSLSDIADLTRTKMLSITTETARLMVTLQKDTENGSV